MASRRDLIREAVQSAVGELDLAGGVQELRRPENDFTTLPTVVVAQLSETKGTQAPTNRIGCQLELAVDLFPEQAEGSIATELDNLIEAVEKQLLALNLLDPPLGIDGCTELVLGGHDVFALEEFGLVGASLQVLVRYRHDVDDPAKYGGVA